MAQIRTILVATDFSKPAERALGHAVGFARTFGAELVLVHALATWGPTRAMLRPKAFPNLMDEMRKGSDALLQELEQRCVPSGLGVRRRIEEGSPAEAILRAAAAENADLIVVGTHGHTGVAHALLGSVAERVVRQSTVPVLMVR